MLGGCLSIHFFGQGVTEGREGQPLFLLPACAVENFFFFSLQYECRSSHK